MHFRYAVFAAAAILLNSSLVHADKEIIIIPKPTGSVKTFKFDSAKGEVVFNHDLHVKVMRNEACLPCHRSAKPTAANINSRFEERNAHAFCRGCHQKRAAGPIGCHDCHLTRKAKPAQ